MKDRCVCNQEIIHEPYFGLELPEQDAVDGEVTTVYFEAGHAGCLKEFGLTLYPEDELGVRHCRHTLACDAVLAQGGECICEGQQPIGDALGAKIDERLTRYLADDGA